MNILVQPSDHSAAYSAMPLRLEDTAALTSTDFKYVTNILWEITEFTSITTTIVGSQIRSVLQCTTPHNLVVGDNVYLNDLNNTPANTGYYSVSAVLTANKVAIDVLLPFTMGSNPANVSKVIKYKMLPDLEGEAKLDISNSIKDFVTQNLVDDGERFAGPNTRFDYQIVVGSESRLIINFDDNQFVADNVGFLTSEYTVPSDVPMEVGDSIFVTQYYQQFDYDDNFFSNDNVGFTATTATHDFEVGTTIQVVGQETNPAYNGYTTVESVPNANSLVTNKPFGLPSPVEGGQIYGIPRPSYNGTATITDIITAATGVIIVTNKPFTTSTSPVPGFIRFSDNRLTEQFNLDRTVVKSAYNAHVNRPDYSRTFYEQYFIDPITCGAVIRNNFISTVLVHDQPTKPYRVEPSTKGFLLTHTLTGTSDLGMTFEYYDSSNALIGRIYQGDNALEDMYSPYGINQIGDNLGNYTENLGVFASYKDNIDHYSVFLSQRCGFNIEAVTNKLWFEVNEDCSDYEVYHLMWKDRYGSFISYPFIKVSRDFTEVERSTYYKTEGNWENDTFGYESYGRGETQYFGRSRDKVTLNSGWMRDYENLQIKDLLESTSVYLQTPEGDLVGCIVEQNALELKKNNNDMIYNYTFNVRISYNEVRF